MKGVVFKSFENYVETTWSDVVLDDALNVETLSTGGAYTSVGDYPPSDFVAMAVKVAQVTDTPIETLIKDFGQDLFSVLAGAHADIIAGFTSCVDMLAGIESVIHRDVRKIYTNAQLPQFDVEARDGDRYLKLVYRSTRPFADLAEGLIRGGFLHYGVNAVASLARYDVKPDGTHSVFEVTIGGANGQHN